jgi:hypothetical protein
MEAHQQLAFEVTEVQLILLIYTSPAASILTYGGRRSGCHGIGLVIARIILCYWSDM